MNFIIKKDMPELCDQDMPYTLGGWHI